MTERPVNTVVDLLDLRSRVTSDDAETFNVRSEVRIGRPELDSPVGMITARRVYLQLELDGYEIRPGNRLGEPVKAGYVEDTKLVTEKNSSASAGASAGVTLSASGRPGGSIGAKAAAGIDAKAKLQTTVKTKVERGYVKAIGGDRWVIASIEQDQHLEEATYVTDNEVLCQLQRSKGANRSAVRIRGYVLKRDLDFVAEKRTLDPFNRNKTQVIKAFLSKKIGEGSTDAGEKLIISEQEISNE